MRIGRLWPVLVVGGLLVGAKGADAAPPTKVACIAAFDRAQKARREGSLLRAREDLVLCSQQGCPALVRADCADVLRAVDAAQPTIVLKAMDAHGNDLTDVVVSLDGKKLAASLDGRPIPVDPGKLSFVFERAPWKPVQVDIVIAEGEKDRIVRAELGPPLPPAPPSAESAARTQLTPEPPRRRSAVGWAVPGGFVLVGGAALAFAGFSRLAIGSDADHERSSCAPACPDEDIAPLRSRLATANVMLVVGLGSLALAAISWFVLAPKAPPRALGSR